MSSNFTKKPLIEVLKITNQQHFGHETVPHDPKPLICFVCEVQFLTDKDLQQHYVEHIALKPYKCEHCDKSFVSERNLKKHVFKHTGLKPYECDICKKRFSEKLKYEIQCRTHGTEHLCNSCCFVFSLNSIDEFEDSFCHNCDTCNQQYLFKPAQEVSNGHAQVLKPHVCVVCGNSFSNKIQLSSHLNSHSNQIKKLSCNICNEEFFNLKDLDKHEKSHIQISQRPDGFFYSCKLCCESFSLQLALETHYNNYHFGETKHACNVCNRNFFLHYTLKTHSRTHFRQTYFKCSFCPKKFTTKTNLKIHHLIHDSIRKFECDVCQKRFLTKINLKLHGLVHIVKGPFKCVDCYLSFNNKKNLKRHYLRHLEEKPFKCDKCPVSYLRKVDLQKHALAHTLNKVSGEYKCKDCLISFINLQYLHNHYRVKHPRTKPYYICNICLKVIRHQASFLRHRKLHANGTLFKYT